ncbi:MAG TPA: cohesin domain-containing protein [Limnochordia bacterium]|nr:cohesin domain-containing protein [Limnochordia bacterium]
MKRTLAMALAAFWLAVQAVPAAADKPPVNAQAEDAQAAPAGDNITLSNDYISILVNNRPEDTGRFAVFTTGGDPTRADDDGKKLIYGEPEPQGPWTSYTTVQVDGQDLLFGGKSSTRAGKDRTYGEVIAPPHVENDQISASWNTAGIKVDQTLGFARSVTTGLLDTALIRYSVTNTTDQPHDVGLRIVLDTMLGDNDGAPFRVDERAITTDHYYSGAQIPSFWQAFDSLSDPHVIAQGTLRAPGLTPPDRVYFTNWGALADGNWDFSFKPGRDFTRLGEFELDSALALYWQPQTLAPGETRTYATEYGVGGITIAPGKLMLGITSPKRVVAGAEASFPILVYLQNAGQGTAQQVAVHLKLPKGLALTGGEADQSLGDLDVGDTRQVKWDVAVPDNLRGQFTFSVSAEAVNSEPNQVERTLEIVSPAKLVVDLPKPSGTIGVVNDHYAPVPYRIDAQVTNVGGSDARNMSAGWKSPIGLGLASGEIAEKPLPDLGPNESTQVHWYVRPTGVTGNLPYTVEARTGADPASVKTGFISVPPLDARVWVSVTDADGKPLTTVAPGDYVFVRINAVNVRDFFKAALDVLYDPNQLRLVGGALGVERGSLFVVPESLSPDGKRQYLTFDKPALNTQAGTLARLHVGGSRAPSGALGSGEGQIAILRMKALAPGAATIRLDNVQLSNPAGDPIDAGISPGTLTIR